MLFSTNFSPTLVFFFSSFLFQPCFAIFKLNQDQSLSDGRTLLSPGENFTLGFFSPPNSPKRYLGISYTKIHIQSIVWVANRENPIQDRSGILKISQDGNLEILDGNNISVWSSNASGLLAQNPTAELSDYGNLVLSDGGNVIFQSFDHPTDAYLPGMRMWTNPKTGKSPDLSSWKSPDNPASGDFSFRYSNEGIASGLLQGILWEGTHQRWRTGPWGGGGFVGVPMTKPSYRNKFTVDYDKNGTLYVSYTLAASDSANDHYLLNSSGVLIYRYWNASGNRWVVAEVYPADQCEIYGFCGANSDCNLNNLPICSCLPGFEPRSPRDWGMGNWSDGCVRSTTLKCEVNGSIGGEDWFLRLAGVKIPDGSGWLPGVVAGECAGECRKNCSCVAFLYLGRLGCMAWMGELVDLHKFSVGGMDLNVRLAAAAPEYDTRGRRKILVIVIVTTVSAIIIGASACFLWMKMAKRRESKRKGKSKVLNLDASAFSSPNILDTEADGNTNGEGTNLVMLDLHIVTIATNNFSIANKLGEGGFGPVYKGILPDGKEIAVKRLSTYSCQGLEEFKNEVIIIAKLQHRNLVRLLGCCINIKEKLLIYEYMPNKSLDAFLFDEAKRRLLDWGKRFKIIEGIARGLLYLHQDSRLRIIHRDLKPSNILLDDQMIPKISDFGMARIFGGNQTQANTNRVAGTYGYMSPEYAMEGLFSEKSDVFSFGIVLLEMITGKRNTSFHHHQHFLNLIGFAWILWNEGKGLELVDPLLYNSFQTGQVLKCIHVALLCVQDGATNRPSMSSVVSMLSSDSTTFPMPKKPAFFIDDGSMATSSTMNNSKKCSINDLTLSIVEGR